MKRLVMALCLIAIFLPSVATNAADKPSKSINIEEFIDDVVHERISPDEVMRISKSLDPEQEKQAWKWFYAKAKPVGHTKEQKEALKRESLEGERRAFPVNEDVSTQACDQVLPLIAGGR